METILQGLVLTALSGITFVAYKHPKAFRLIDDFTGRIILAGLCIFYGFTLGYYSGHSDGKNGIEKAFEFEFWYSFIPMGYLLYFAFLRAFPLIFENEKDDDPKSPQSEETNKALNQSSETTD